MPNLKAPKQNEITFTVIRNDNTEFKHLKILVKAYAGESMAFEKGNFTFTWLTDTKHDYWFGFNVEIEANDMERLAYSVKVAKKITNGIRKDRGMFDPQEIVDRLLAMRNCHRVVYDSRTHYDEYVENVYPPEYHMWMDAPSDDAGRQCSCLARNEQEAQAKILTNWTSWISSSWDKEKTAQLFALWIANGQQVENMSRRSYGPSAPTVETLKDLLKI
jgi:hypothetical protein